MRYIADVSVNGHPDVRGRAKPKRDIAAPRAPYYDKDKKDGTKQILDRNGADGVSQWMRAQSRTLITDTTMRDAHQSLLATRMRTHDIVNIADAYAKGLPELFSLECWGGATFDVAMRFLTEDPWERLEKIRAHVPNILLQCLVRGSNGVGYKSYPENAVQYFIKQAALGGVDLFRVFDSLNWVENTRVSIDAIVESGKICEGAICYTGDLMAGKSDIYTVDYYQSLAKEFADAGVHIIGLKDMGGLMKPDAAKTLVKAIRDVTDLPIHFHTHDTSGISAATTLAAIEAGVDAIDAAMDPLSGLTSQPCLGSIVAALHTSERASGLDEKAIRDTSFYWEAVRNQYAAFESDLKGPASEVYLHEMPGGQFTNLKEQARALGLESRWHEVAQTYADVNVMFGDIVKVTPSSKVVGDMALMMVASDLTVEDVLDPDKEVAFPESVVDMLSGNLGQPPRGWPEALQKKALKGAKPITAVPGSLLPPADLKAERKKAEDTLNRPVSDQELASYLMYPKVFVDYAKTQDLYGPTSVLPTRTYFYGMEAMDEVVIDLEQGKTLIVFCRAVGETDEMGEKKVFFDLNGQPRTSKVPDRAHGAVGAAARPKAEDGNDDHLAAPMPGVISTVAVKSGQKVNAGDVVLSIEAMKMETVIHAERDGTILEIFAKAGDQIDAKDLLVVYGS